MPPQHPPYQGYPAPSYPVGVSMPVNNQISNNNQTTVVVQQQATQVAQQTVVTRCVCVCVCVRVFTRTCMLL